MSCIKDMSHVVKGIFDCVNNPPRPCHKLLLNRPKEYSRKACRPCHKEKSAYLNIYIYIYMATRVHYI